MNQGDKLVEEILGGNLRAFDILVKDYERLVLFIVNKFVSERQDQEDLSQEVFIKVYYKLPTFRFNSKLSTWIAQIAYRTAINYLRKINADRRVDINQDLDSVHIVEASPESILIKKDASAYLNYLIDQMPVNYKTVLTLYHLNEFSYQEIEVITGLPEGTVKSYLFRARKLLKEKLKVYQKNEMI